jgi:tRNA A37 methylthiotransferase MiaB
VPPQGIKLTPRHYAYLKISEGCNHRCTFCIIPSMRGDLVSRPIGEVLAEAERLLTAGRARAPRRLAGHERYGVDVRYRTGFWQGRPLKTRMTELATALDAMARAHGAWVAVALRAIRIRTSTRSSSGMTDDPAAGGLLPYLDVPFQHASPRILKLMKRPAQRRGHVARASRHGASARPDLVIRSTFIAGFPGETEAEFEELLRFSKRRSSTASAASPYSPVEGAAANALPDPVPARSGKSGARDSWRCRKRSAREARAARRNDDDRAGRRHEGKTAIARSAADAPENRRNGASSRTARPAGRLVRARRRHRHALRARSSRTSFEEATTMARQHSNREGLPGREGDPPRPYYGVQTLRGKENFYITGIPMSLEPNFVKAFGYVKKGAALANSRPGRARREDRRRDRGGVRRLIAARCATSSSRLHPGRRRDVDQHERERGHREPRARRARPQEGRVPVRQSQRSRELRAVDERHVSDGVRWR